MISKIFQHYWIYLIISLFVILPGMITIFRFGLRPSIDFVGGSLIELEFINSSILPSSDIEEILSPVTSVDSIQSSGRQSIIIRTKTISNQQKDEMLKLLAAAKSPVKEKRFESVGPTLGRELLIKTVIAVIIVSIVITLYIMRQFSELKYGIAAVLAMFHDTAVLFSVFAILGVWLKVEIDVLFVTAVLTTLSFSVHDTIVFFDRIRELRKKHKSSSLKSIVNTAVLQTISRSINNSLTIIIMLLSLVILGGESIRWFSVALLVGAITGTYSSTFTAVPILLLSEDILQWKINKFKRSTTNLSKKLK